MILTKRLEEVAGFLKDVAVVGGSKGLVPTMGALHRGHISLVEKCRSENRITMSSIFVNPAQFNNPDDLKNYPRTVEKDLKMLEAAGCDMVFLPAEKTIYPEPDTKNFNFGYLEEIMEGKYRPGHFNGVAQVVSRLFTIMKPDKAYFGEKDFQQLAIVRKMTTMLALPVEIISSPTIREEGGLAMSSRNERLNPQQRKEASIIYRTLLAASEKKDMPLPQIKKWVTETINANPLFRVEYFEIVDRDTLLPLENCHSKASGAQACIAVHAGEVRLIDNLFFPNFA